MQIKSFDAAFPIVLFYFRTRPANKKGEKSRAILMPKRASRAIRRNAEWA